MSVTTPVRAQIMFLALGTVTVTVSAVVYGAGAALLAGAAGLAGLLVGLALLIETRRVAASGDEVRPTHRPVAPGDEG